MEDAGDLKWLTMTCVHSQGNQELIETQTKCGPVIAPDYFDYPDQIPWF